MYRFWEAITEPILEALEPKVLVEIGSDKGPHTRRLLQYCRRHDARLHVIDPLPKYDVAAWQEEYGERLIFHKALSLEALPVIDGFDAVLIDGDHNWYTVYHELKLIEERSEASSRPFPLVMLHDVGWPYGPRDSYYNPDDIPKEYLQPYEEKGLRPGSAALLEEGGYNSTVANAISENSPQNGVLTAVEDFLEETGREIELMRLSGLHGLAILVPTQLKEQNAELAAFLEKFEFSPAVARYLELLEDARLDAEMRQLQANERRHEADVRRSRADARRSRADERWHEADERRQEADERRQEAEAHRSEADKRLQEQMLRNEHLVQQLEDIKNSRSWRLLTRIDQLRAKVRNR